MSTTKSTTSRKRSSMSSRKGSPSSRSGSSSKRSSSHKSRSRSRKNSNTFSSITGSGYFPYAVSALGTGGVIYGLMQFTPTRNFMRKMWQGLSDEVSALIDSISSTISDDDIHQAIDSYLGKVTDHESVRSGSRNLSSAH